MIPRVELVRSCAQAALTESSRKSRDEKIHEIFDRFDEDYDMVLNASEYGNLLATVDPECDGKDVDEIEELANDDFERYTDAVTIEGLTEVGLRMLVDYNNMDADKAYLNHLVRQSEVRSMLDCLSLHTGSTFVSFFSFTFFRFASLKVSPRCSAPLLN